MAPWLISCIQLCSILIFSISCDLSILRNRDNDVSRFGNTDFPQLVGEMIDSTLFKMFACVQMDASIANKLSKRWLDHHGLIYIDLLLYHRGATFYTLLWKTRLFINDWFKPTARFKVFQKVHFGLSKDVTPIWANRWKLKQYKRFTSQNIFARQNGWANLLKRSLWNERKSVFTSLT